MMNTISKKESFFSPYGLLYRGYKNYKRNIVILTVLGFLSGFFESIGVTIIIPLFSFITGGGGKTLDTISQFIAKVFSFFGITYTFRYLLILIIILFLFRALTLIVSNYIRIKISADYEANTRSRLFATTLHADWPYLLTQRLGHLETIIMNNVRYGDRLLNSISTILVIGASMLMYLIVALNISVLITLGTLLLGIIMFFVFQPLIQKTRVLAKKAEAINREVAHHINENIVGMKTVKSMLVTDSVIDIGRKYFEHLKQFRIKITLFQVIPGTLMQPVGLIFVVFLFAFSYKTPGFNIAALAAIVYLIQRTFVYVQQLQGQVNFVNESIPYLREILSYEEQARLNKENINGQIPFVFEKSLQFNNVSFSYHKKRSVLININFKVDKGQMVGLIGPSGGGKTTVVDLILRLFKPSVGEIDIDGKNIDEINLAEWRKNIGYVSQDIFLKNSTVLDNIRFYSGGATDGDIVKAAKMADIFDFIETLPKKFETVIGERGVTLSAGQRQRIVIARVLARKPKLLILDEATSALDNESEGEIQKVIEKLKGDLTVFIIAHRLSTVINADNVIVLAGGKIIEEGNPQKLLDDPKSYFFRVYNSVS